MPVDEQDTADRDIHEIGPGKFPGAGVLKVCVDGVLTRFEHGRPKHQLQKATRDIFSVLSVALRNECVAFLSCHLLEEGQGTPHTRHAARSLLNMDPRLPRGEP